MDWIERVPWQLYLAAAIAALIIVSWRRARKKDLQVTTDLVQSMLSNLKESRGIEADAQSIQWLFEHPTFAAAMWKILAMPNFEIASQKPSRQLRADLELILPYDEFKLRYPAAASVFDHVLEWCRPDEA
jgi:hypothetical protein